MWVCVTLEKEGTPRVTWSYFDRSPIVFTDEKGREVDFYRTYGDWLQQLAGVGFIVTDLLEPEPLPKESTYKDDFPLEQIRFVPGTVIWRARKPKRLVWRCATVHPI